MDIGCGEGWLARELSSLGLNVSGLDVVPELIQEAKKNGQGEFHLMAYQDLSNSLITEKFDVAVCNFSLIGKESVEHIFKVTPDILNKGGYLIIQTLHPIMRCKEHSYQDAWREGSWAGFDNSFRDPAPWYFRTIASWFKLFNENGYNLVQLEEPLNPETGEAASLIMVARVAS